MSDKDQLLKQQREEIEKLKKELQDASKPSSMFSVFKNTMKRNVHDFFIREDKMKTMDSKIKDLEADLAKKEEELSRTSAELFAANLQTETYPRVMTVTMTGKTATANHRMITTDSLILITWMTILCVTSHRIAKRQLNVILEK